MANKKKAIPKNVKNQPEKSRLPVVIVSVVVVLIVAIVAVVAISQNKNPAPTPAATATPSPKISATPAATAKTAASAAPVTQEDLKADGKAQIEMEDGGKILIALYPQVAPKTVENFKGLVKSGFYNGLTFHRVISGFMIQGGDPKGDGTGGSEQTIPGEFSSNGFTQNTLKHSRGVVSMARANDPNSASSQFFIMHKDTKSLDGNYAAFGKVIEGMDEVDKIAAVKTDSSDKPVTPVKIKSITLVE